jgi:hypothetical protein
MVLRAEERQKLHASRPQKQIGSIEKSRAFPQQRGYLPDGMTVFAYRRYSNALTGMICLPADC